MLLGAAGPTPAPGPLRVVGGDGSGGCIAGAERLPAAGEGFQTLHLNRSSFWGAAPTIERVKLLGAQAHRAGLADFYVEDISNPRGGPMAGGHAAHQVGLDVDIGLDPRPKAALTPAERELLEEPLERWFRASEALREDEARVFRAEGVARKEAR